jgi:ribosomal protein S18 acetylase RimI-like enzyme
VVTLREVAADREELAALQRVIESDEDYFLRVTGHPPGPADAQSTLRVVPEGTSPDDKARLRRLGRRRAGRAARPAAPLPRDETIYIGLLLIDRAHQGQGVGTAAIQALQRDLLPRWPWARRLRLSVVRANDQTLGFWRRLGFTETGEVRPWRYDKLESESILMDKVIPARRGGGPGPAGGRGGGAR